MGHIYCRIFCLVGVPCRYRFSLLKVMTTGKKNQKKLKENHNPADEGLDHNVFYGDERDLEESYLLKQEAMNRRGVDNEEDAEDDSADSQKQTD